MNGSGRRALSALVLGAFASLWADTASGDALPIWSPLSSFASAPQTGRVFRNEIQSQAFSDIDYPWRLLKRRYTLGSEARNDPTRLFASTRLTFEDVSQKTSVGLVWRSDIFAATNPSIADEARWIVAGYTPFYHRLDGQIEVMQWQGFGPRVAHRALEHIGNLRVEVAGAFSVIRLDEMTIARGTGAVRRIFGAWTKLEAQAEVSRSGRTLPFQGQGGSHGWAWSGDFAADLRSTQGTGLSLVVNDAFAETRWARIPTTQYSITVVNESLRDCCRVDRDPTVSFVNKFTEARVRLPLKWRAEVYQRFNQFRFGVGRASAYDVEVGHLSLGVQSGADLWSIEHSLGSGSSSLSLQTPRTQIQVSFRPSAPGRSHALMLGLAIATPY